MTYTTNFANTENPISEGGKWQNGAANGVDWTNCRTKSGLVFGTESGTSENQYDDSTLADRTGHRILTEPERYLPSRGGASAS